MIKILFLIFLFSFTSFSSEKEKEQRQESLYPHFSLEKDLILLQTGEENETYSLSLKNFINLDTNQNKSLLIDYFYKIQTCLLNKNLKIESVRYTSNGVITAITNQKKYFKFLDYKLEEQVSTLEKFFSTPDSEDYLKNFKGMDLRNNSRIAISYL
tara:strand:- start:1312 stop:1779 length:468 start_codon:yes stop_codon:yes gene_type:complete